MLYDSRTFKYLIIFQTDPYDVKIEISSCNKKLKKNNYDIKIFLILKILRRRTNLAFQNFFLNLVKIFFSSKAKLFQIQFNTI